MATRSRRPNPGGRSGAEPLDDPLDASQPTRVVDEANAGVPTSHYAGPPSADLPAATAAMNPVGGAAGVGSLGQGGSVADSSNPIDQAAAEDEAAEDEAEDDSTSDGGAEVLEEGSDGEFKSMKKRKRKGRPKISFNTKMSILIVYGWARLVRRKQSTLSSTNDLELLRWHALLYYNKDAGQVKNLLSPYRKLF